MEVFVLGPYEVTILRAAGPRIVGFRRTDGPQVFASLPDAVIERDGPPFRFHGGHRLWTAPEVPAQTYRPDDDPVEVVDDGDRVRVVGPPDASGITKSIELAAGEEGVTVDHVVVNGGTSAIRLAPWAITQLTPGGEAFLPLASRVADPDGVLPNRSIALWPYTDPRDVVFQPAMIRISATRALTPTKVGSQNRTGWLAYALDGELFIKWSPLHRDDEEYPDLGSSIEVYRDHRFLELESLGPLVTLQPGEAAHHREEWALKHIGDADPLDFLPVTPQDSATP